MRIIFVPLIIVSFLTGCVSYVHKKPEPVTIANEKFINKPTDKVWSDIFHQLFNDAFTLQSSDKSTGTIVVTFKTERPTNYIDCGIVKTNYRDTNKVNHEYTYNYAESTQYLHDKNGQTYNADVKTTLDAIITAKVSEAGSGSTITINADYTLTRKTTDTNVTDDAKLPIETEEIKFTSTKPYKTEKFSCITTGAIEHNLLDGVN